MPRRDPLLIASSLVLAGLHCLHSTDVMQGGCYIAHHEFMRRLSSAKALLALKHFTLYRHIWVHLYNYIKMYRTFPVLLNTRDAASHHRVPNMEKISSRISPKPHCRSSA